MRRALRADKGDMARNAGSNTAPANPYAAPAVHGLDAGRDRARRAQRRRRRRDRLGTFVMVTILAAAVGGAAWFAYTAYIEHDTTEQIETDRRVAELKREQADETTDDIIGELEETPAWNGPGNPTFGVDKP